MGCGASTQQEKTEAAQDKDAPSSAEGSAACQAVDAQRTQAAKDRDASAAESKAACQHDDARCNKDAKDNEQKIQDIENIDPDGFAVASSESVAQDSKELEQKNMAPNSVLTEVQVAKLHQIFDIVDKNHDGTMTKKELLIALKKYPVVRTLFEISPDDVAAIQDDFEGQGRLGLAETSWSHMSHHNDLSVTWQEFMGHFAGNPQSALKGIELHQRQKTSDSLKCVERPKFEPTKDWQPVPKGAVCPKGLEYKMDLNTGETLARLC